MKARPVNGNSPGEINAALVAWLSDHYGPGLFTVFVSVLQNRKTPAGLLAGQEIDLSGMYSIPTPAAGIPQKALDKIFQSYFTTKPTGQDTGLGLSISYDIMKAHGGELRVETKTDAGATFIIVLPLN